MRTRTSAPILAARKVLVVDDHESARVFFARLLQAHGASVVTASDGAEALALVRQQPFDAIVSDVQMPTMDGFGFLAALGFPESAAAWPPVYLHSAEADELKDQALSAGVTVHDKAEAAGIPTAIAALIAQRS